MGSTKMFSNHKNIHRFKFALFFAFACLSYQGLAADYMPNVERREVVTPGIDTENFEISAVMSILSVKDFSIEPHFSARLAYHFHEDFFVELQAGQADVGLSSVERSFSSGTISNLRLFDDRRYTDYHLSLGWEVLNGQSSFLGQRNVIHNTYFVAGSGVTQFAETNNNTVNLGIGHRLIFTDNLAIRLEGKDYVVLYGSNGPGTTTGRQHNIALSVGLSLFF